MTHAYLPQRLALYLMGLFSMAFGIALSCKANLGTTPISSVPYVLSMCTPYTVGELTIVMNLVFIALQPLLLRAFYWRQILGQLVTLLIFGSSIDACMYLLSSVNPQSLPAMWAACLFSTVVLALGVYLCVTAKVFVAAGEGLVLTIDFLTKLGFPFLKNCFDLTLVAISISISYYEFASLRAVGLGTIAAAILCGRLVKFYSQYLTSIKRYA